MKVRLTPDTTYGGVRSEIYGHDVLAEAHAELRNGHMMRVGLVGIEGSAVPEFDDESGVVRTRRPDDVGADRQLEDAFNGMQPAEARPVILASRLRDVLLVLETHNVGQHSRGLKVHEVHEVHKVHGVLVCGLESKA